MLPDNRVRLDGLTSLRWFAAFAVFAYHFRNFAELPHLVFAGVKYGYLGVTFFFVLSGFVLTWSMRAGTPMRTFYWRRFARVFPLHVVALLLALPVFVRFTADPAQPWIHPVDIGALLLCLFLLQAWWSSPAILFAGNPTAWTLSVEAFFYALHPFIARVVRVLSRRGALILAVITVAVAFGTRTAAAQWPGSIASQLPQPVVHLNEFVLGMCLAWAFRKGWLPRIPITIPVIGLLLFVGALNFPDAIPMLRPLSLAAATYSTEVATLLFAVLIIATASRDVRNVPGIIRHRVFIKLGEWSFAFYLVHSTFIYIALEVFGFQVKNNVANGLWFLALLALSIALSAFLHECVEKPVEAKLRAFQDRRMAARAQASRG